MSSIRDGICEEIRKNYAMKEARPWRDLPEYITFSDPETGKWFALFMTIGKDKLGLPVGLPGTENIDILDVKAAPDFILLMAGRDGILPAYHMNRRNWITVLLDGSVKTEQVLDLIDASYRIVTDSPRKRIYEAVKKIPKGHVATYAQIAAMAGNPQMQRAVGNALHHNPDEENIPCFRVVNAQGKLSGAFAFGGPDEQAKRLIADGVEVKDGKVDLTKYQYRGEAEV